MVEKILERIVNEMAPHLDQGQLEHLNNVLHINFHGLEVQEQCTELEALRVNCMELRDRAMVEFLYSTGVRVSEMVALNVGDIEMGKQELVVYGKGSKERKTYLTDGAKFYLRRYLQTRKQEGLSEEPLFVTLDSPHNRLTVAGVQYMLRQLGERAKVKNTHPHRFRRTIATDLLSRGMPIEQVKEFLGHEKLDTTMIYCTVKEASVQSSHKKYA